MIELIDKIGYKEFVIQLIQYEKPRYTRRLAEKIFQEFIEEEYYASIFELESLCIEEDNAYDIYLREEHDNINDLSTILQEEYLDFTYDKVVRVTTDYYIGVNDDAFISNIHIIRSD